MIALPLGRFYEIKETPPRSPVSQPLLEQSFKQNRRLMPSHNVIEVSFEVIRIVGLNSDAITGNINLIVKLSHDGTMSDDSGL